MEICETRDHGQIVFESVSYIPVVGRDCKACETINELKATIENLLAEIKEAQREVKRREREEKGAV